MKILMFILAIIVFILSCYGSIKFSSFYRHEDMSVCKYLKEHDFNVLYNQWCWE